MCATSCSVTASGHWAVSIRKFTRRIRDLNQLVGLGSLTQQAAEFLRMCVLAGQNILVSGATQTGKTTMLNALLSSTRQNERSVTVEETFELDLTARRRGHGVSPAEPGGHRGDHTASAHQGVPADEAGPPRRGRSA
jgi:Flp pilus assembly CpaF family ATPase